MAPRRVLACFLVLALCAFAPSGIEAKKKRQVVATRAGRGAMMAPAPAPMGAIGRALLQADGTAELPAEPAQQPTDAAAQAPAQAPSEPAEPVEAPAEAPAQAEPAEEKEAPPDASKPAPAWGQCGGDDKYVGPTTCAENTTCVHLSSTFSQCVDIPQSRAYGCSARYAQCGGADPGKSTSPWSAWSGPYCCPEASECVTFSSTYSQCKPCNALYEQCGGLIPGTDQVWSEHGRASCCAASVPSACKYMSSGFYQCQPV